MRGSKREWMFRVQVTGLARNENVYVVGNVPELGSWNHTESIQLQSENSNSNSPELSENNDGGSSGDTNNDQNSFRDNFLNEPDEGQIFSQTIELPTDVNVDFRYFIAVVCQLNEVKNPAQTLIIRKWETHMTPRLIKKDKLSNIAENSLPEPDQFGYNNGYFKIENGWLTEETVIQFKVFNNAIKLWKNRLQNRKVHIKMTPVNLVRHNSLEMQHLEGECVDDSLSMDTQDIVDHPAFSITEIALMTAMVKNRLDAWCRLWELRSRLVDWSYDDRAMNDEEAHFKYQEQFGREYNEEDFVIFNVAVRYPETIAYLVDYYVYSSRCPDEPPNHIGFSYILPSTIQSSVGIITVPITSTKHRPIGQLTVEYVTIKPIADQTWDMSISYAKHWEKRWSGLDVGHRGLGTSFKFEMKNCANVRENTIASLKTAAYHGADMVEFDVQLSKDFIPVIYHDFYVSISLKRKKQIEAMDMLEIPVKDLTLEQLHLLKDFSYPDDSLGKVLHFTDKDAHTVNQVVYHLAEAREKTAKFFDEDLEDHQPFPTLQSVLQVLEQHVGCNIEIKWTMQLKDGTFELNHPFDLNVYLDIILKVVLEYGCDRKIVFSSFNPDICAMIRLKQNKYPVVFLTQGVTAKYPMYHDTRCQTIPMAVRHALAADILGINVHTEDILRDPSQVKLVRNAGLIIFCWGDDNNDKDTIQHLKRLGLHGVIYDKIDEYNAKEVKESIFLVDARESQKELIAVASCTHTAGLPQSIMSGPINPENKQEQDKEIGDLAKNLSVCAKTFGQSTKTKSSEIVGNQTSDFSKINTDKETAKDCL